MAITPASEIVDAARGLSNYAAIYGIKLSDGFHQKLAAAMEKVEKDSWDFATEQDLGAAVAASLERNKPLTMDDVRRGLDNVRPVVSRVPPGYIYGGLLAWTVFLLICILPLSVYFEQIKSGLSNIQEVTKVNFVEIAQLHEAVRLRPGDARAEEAFHENRAKLRAFVRRGWVETEHSLFLASQTHTTLLNRVVAGLLPGDPLDSISRSLPAPPTPNAGRATAPDPPPTQPLSPPSPGVSADATPPPTPPAAPPPQNGATRPLAPVDGASQPVVATPPAPPVSPSPAPAAGSSSIGVDDFILVQEVFGMANTLRTQTRALEPISMLIGGSILPLLYGLLGASVFLLRSGLTLFAGPASPRVVVASVLLRVGLGGIAGLAIGWFQTDTAKLTTTPFAVAFLAGFSIELLFSLLDRIITAIGTAPQSHSNAPLSTSRV